MTLLLQVSDPHFGIEQAPVVQALERLPAPTWWSGATIHLPFVLPLHERWTGLQRSHRRQRAL